MALTYWSISIKKSDRSYVPMISHPTTMNWNFSSFFKSDSSVFHVWPNTWPPIWYQYDFIICLLYIIIKVGKLNIECILLLTAFCMACFINCTYANLILSEGNRSCITTRIRLCFAIQKLAKTPWHDLGK